MNHEQQVLPLSAKRDWILKTLEASWVSCAQAALRPERGDESAGVVVRGSWAINDMIQ